MDFIHTLASQSQLPVVTAFLLGLVVALHPCPLATNIAAMGYIARNTGRSRLFVSGMFYTLGRVLAYTLLGVALLLLWRGSAWMLSLGERIGQWGERLLAPMLLLFGVYLLLAPRLHRHAHCPHVVSGGHRFHGTWGSLLLGAILALTFCPESHAHVGAGVRRHVVARRLCPGHVFAHAVAGVVAVFSPEQRGQGHQPFAEDTKNGTSLVCRSLHPCRHLLPVFLNSLTTLSCTVP